MARSQKQTPKLGFSTSVSEKDDKARAARKERRATKSDLVKTSDADAHQGEHRRAGGWTFAKDGKRWVKTPPLKSMRK